MRAALLPWAVALLVPFSLLGALLLPPTPPAARAAEAGAAAGDDDLVKKVQESIARGVKFLKNQQKNDHWETNSPICIRDPGGFTALALLALLTSGADPDKDDHVRRGLDWLRRTKRARSTYAVSLETMVYCLAGQKADRVRIQENLDWLLKARQKTGWTYSDRAGMADNSCTQYALLALHETIQAGFKVDDRTLQQLQQLFLSSQAGGGWGYRPGDKAATMTMTTAGLCNLIITGLDLARGRATLLADGSARDCGEYDETEAVQKALSWIGTAFPRQLTEVEAYSRLVHPFYCLYGIERAGRFSGQRYFGGHDWYEVGCRFLVSAKQQRPDGSWGGRVDKTFDHWPVVSTSFALLFLAKGKTPVLIAKLAYGDRDYSGWNNKRNDMKHLAEYAGKVLFKGKPMAWQAFDVRRTEATTQASRRQLAAALLQTPIVFLNGHDRAPTGKEAEVLREYVANGGFLFAENCCGKARHPEFDKDFRRLIKEIFPEASLEPLEPEHPLWLASGQFASSPRDFPLLGVKMGCKTVVVYSPVPLAGYWEHNAHPANEAAAKLLDKATLERGKKAFELAANVIAYATGLEAPRPRLSRVEIAAEDTRAKPKRGYFHVAQLRHEGDWQPAPKAMRNLMQEARKDGLDVVLKTEPVRLTAEAVLDHRFLYLHGRGEFTAKKDDLKHLRFNLKSGGLLLADACCGSKAFDGSFRRLIGELFAGDGLKLQPIPLSDELYSAAVNGTAIRTVRRRELKDDKRVDPELKEKDPALEGVKYRGRWVVIYSRYDIGCALEKHASPECLGHDPASAMRLARAAVLYALKR